MKMEVVSRNTIKIILLKKSMTQGKILDASMIFPSMICPGFTMNIIWILILILTTMIHIQEEVIILETYIRMRIQLSIHVIPIICVVITPKIFHNRIERITYSRTAYPERK